MKIRTLFMATAIAAASYAAPAFATSCAVGDITPTAIACEGRFTGNVLSNNAGDITIQKNALALLGYAWDGTGFGTLPKLSPLGGVSSIDFPGVLSGITYVGIHVGGAGGGTTSFYRFNAGTNLDAFTLNLPASSGAVLYWTDPGTPGVPEPSNWAFMLSGFAMLGGVMRLRRGQTASLV